MGMGILIYTDLSCYYNNDLVKNIHVSEEDSQTTPHYPLFRDDKCVR